jgi:hypothetical protein
MRRQRGEAGCTHRDGGGREITVSALPPKRTSISATRNVRFVPILLQKSPKKRAVVGAEL